MQNDLELESIAFFKDIDTFESVLEMKPVNLVKEKRTSSKYFDYAKSKCNNTIRLLVLCSDTAIETTLVDPPSQNSHFKAAIQVLSLNRKANQG